MLERLLIVEGHVDKDPGPPSFDVTIRAVREIMRQPSPIAFKIPCDSNEQYLRRYRERSWREEDLKRQYMLMEARRDILLFGSSRRLWMCGPGSAPKR